ncbi:TIGR03089 family protein [Rothia uropygioeca]|uniref:TIGR03089 family protein n=1 Tax=Kocuria sp. 257 TaxID=2021970 RepID=UPI00101120FA|nr:TIGR03089 family protein [Kocuria sp. 257]
MTHTPSPQNFANLETFSRFLASSSRPALIWYGPDSERIELSGKVTENWIAKSANLFVDELDAAHGDSLDIAAPPHWRSIAATLGALRAGCVVNSDNEASTFWLGFDVDDRAAEAETAVFMARGALAMSYDQEVQQWPDDSLDYCAEIRSFGDLFDPIDAVMGSHRIGRAVVNGAYQTVTLNEWLELASSWCDRVAQTDDDRQGIMVDAGSQPLNLDFLARVCGIVAAGKALVLVDSSVGRHEERLATIASEEKAEFLD